MNKVIEAIRACPVPPKRVRVGRAIFADCLPTVGEIVTVQKVREQMPLPHAKGYGTDWYFDPTLEPDAFVLEAA